MAVIQPVKIWQNGVEKEATILNVSSYQDNLLNEATFNYTLGKPYEADLLNNSTYATGSLIISGQDYIDWDTQTNANEWAYSWVATQLNLVIISY